MTMYVRQKDIMEYLVVFMMIATSGANWSIFLLTIPCIIWGCKYKIKSNNFITAIILSVLLFINSAILNIASFDVHEYFVFVLRFMCVAVVCSVMTYSSFMDKYILIIKALYLISIPVWLIGVVQNVVGIEFCPALITEYFLHGTVSGFPRMRAIFWEAGVCQIHGNLSVLYLIITDRLIKEKKNALIYVLGIIFTMSTTGYLILALQVVLYTVKTYKWPRIGKGIIVVMILGLAAIILEELTLGIITSKIIYHKTSGTSRFDDTVLGLLITKDYFLTGIGVSTHWREVFLDYFYNNEVYLAVGKYNQPDLASSNGLANCLYKTGIFFTAYYLWRIFDFFKSKVTKKSFQSIVILGIFVFIFIGEPIMSVPLFLCFLYEFNSEKLSCVD